MSQNNTLRISHQLCHPIYSVTNTLMRLYKPLLAPLNITYPQYLIMMVLWEEEGINMNTVSERTFFDSGTLTPLIQKLEHKSLIHVETDKNDRRNKILFLTAKGLRLKSIAHEIPRSLKCFIPFSKVEAQSFVKMTQTLHKALLEAEGKSK